MTTKLANNEDWKRLLALAESGDHIAQYQVASNYDFGLFLSGTEIVEENGSMAFKWYHKAYENGSHEAFTRLADFFSEGIYCKKDIALAIELYQKGIDHGNAVAANNLAIVYRDQQDYKKAFELYKIAQDLGNANSLEVALCCYFGIGTKKDIKNSFEIFKKIATEHANTQYEIDEANYFLGRLYLEGEIVEKSIAEARFFLQLANADNDHRSAQELLMLIGKG